PLFEKALAIWRKALGEQHPHTATGYNNLAQNLDAQGKHAEAEPLYEKALAIHRQVLGEEYPDTATSYNNLGYNLDAQGKAAQAPDRDAVGHPPQGPRRAPSPHRHQLQQPG